jgi:LPS-assembly protein
VARLVVNRYATATGQANNSLFFQLELSGLGGIGTDPLSLLKRSIPGYSKLDSQRSWSSRTE